MNAILLKECTDDNLREYAKNIQSAGQQLLSIVNDVLDISKIESGKMEILPVEYEIFSILNDCYQMVRARLEARPIEFEMQVNENLPSRLYGDEVRVRQVINNFLTNVRDISLRNLLLKGACFNSREHIKRIDFFKDYLSTS